MTKMHKFTEGDRIFTPYQESEEDGRSVKTWCLEEHGIRYLVIRKEWVTASWRMTAQPVFPFSSDEARNSVGSPVYDSRKELFRNEGLEKYRELVIGRVKHHWVLEKMADDKELRALGKKTVTFNKQIEKLTEQLDEHMAKVEKHRGGLYAGLAPEFDQGMIEWFFTDPEDGEIENVAKNIHDLKLVKS